MATLPQRLFTAAEYLALERQALDKHEFYRGEIFAMAGAKKEHVRISRNILRHFANQLDGQPCEPFNSDLRVKVSATGLYTYPEVSVACPPLEFEDDNLDVLLNPRVLVEVLSPSTERRDRTFKLSHYQQLPSLEAILLVRQDQAFVELYTRKPDGSWQFDHVWGLAGTFTIECIGCRLTMQQVYQNVDLPPEESLGNE